MNARSDSLETDTNSLSTKRDMWRVLLITAVILTIYSNTLGNPFVFDDTGHIPENPHIRLDHLSIGGLIDAATKSMNPSRPVAYISFAINYYLHGYDVFGYHLVNIAIHCITAVLLYFFVDVTIRLPGTQLGMQPGRIVPFATAFIWAVHPLHTQSITYIVQRMNSMAAMFYILSMLLYTIGRLTPSENNGKKAILYVACFVSGVGAIGSKQIAATLPIMLFLYEWMFFQSSDRNWLKRNLRHLAIPIAVCIVLAGLYLGQDPIHRILGPYEFRNFTMQQRLLTELRVIFFYLSLIFFPLPSRLSLDHDFPLSHSLLDPVTTLLALLAIIAALSYAVFVVRKQPLVSFAIFWFFGNLAIESSFLPIEIVFEHRTYLPSMFVVLLVVCLTDRFLPTRMLKIALWGCLVLVCAIFTYERNKIWENPVTLWQDCVDKAPNKARAHFNLAVSLMEHRLWRETKADYIPDPAMLKKEIFHFREALRLNPNQLGPHNDLALSLLKIGQFDEAIQHFRFVLNRVPGNDRIVINLAQAFLSKGDSDQALREVRSGLKSSPDSALLHNALGVLLAKKGRIREALEHWKQALWLQPDLTEAQNNLQEVLSPNGAVDQAIQTMESKSQIDPKGALLFELGFLYKEKGDLEQAKERFQQAIQLSPDSMEAMQQLALVHAMMGHYEDAISVYKEIISRHPQESFPYYAIASVFSMKNETNEALGWLQKAVDKGFSDWHRLDTDPNLENLRNAIDYPKWKARQMR